MPTWPQTRDRLVRAIERPLDAWAQALGDQMTGVALRSEPDISEATRGLAITLSVAIDRLIRLMGGYLGGVTVDGYGAASSFWVSSTSPRVFVNRALFNIGVRTEAIGTDPDGTRAIRHYRKILDGSISPDSTEARELVRKWEFPSPSRAKVADIVQNAPWPDGLAWPDRIKTVMPEAMDRLLDSLATSYADTTTGISGITEAVEEATDLVHWQARRIARTEGLRVAQEGLREADKAVEDLLAGRRWFSALVKDTRHDHAARHKKLYKQITPGLYVADDGEVEPPIPLGPNCLCWDEGELDESIVGGLPDPDYGPGFKAALDNGEYDLSKWKRDRG